jgi:hypothetical protein
MREVVSIVTFRFAEILNVKPTTSPAAVPGTTGGLQLAAVLQLPFALTFQFPLLANADMGKEVNKAKAQMVEPNFIKNPLHFLRQKIHRMSVESVDSVQTFATKRRPQLLINDLPI